MKRDAAATSMDRVVLITGAAGTLGRVAALAAAGAGATVVLLDKNREKLEKVYDDIIAAGFPQPAIYPLDLTTATEQEFAFLAARIEQEFDRLDGLLHTAAELGVLGPIVDLGAVQMEQLWRVNCFAPQQMTRALLPLLNRTGHAVIIFTTDSAARRGKAYWGAYGITKIAMEGLARILADELEGLGRIQVEIFEPGPFLSPIHCQAFPGADRATLPSAESFSGSLLRLLGVAGDRREHASSNVDNALFSTYQGDTNVRT